MLQIKSVNQILIRIIILNNMLVMGLQMYIIYITRTRVFVPHSFAPHDELLSGKTKY